MEGWIKIHRKFSKWEWYDDSKSVHLFLHMLLKANHEPRRWRGVTIDTGQFITSLNKLAAETSMSVRSVRTIIDRLKTTREVTCETTSQFTILTICKWSSYQSSEIENDTPNDTPNDKRPTHDRHTTDTRPTTNKNEENDKNDKNEEKNTARIQNLLTALRNRYSLSTPDLSPFKAAIAESVKAGFAETSIDKTLAWLSKQTKWNYTPAFNTPNKLKDNLPALYAKSQERDNNKPINIQSNISGQDFGEVPED